MALLTSQFCGNRTNNSDDHIGLVMAFSGFSGTNCTNACLRGCWLKFSSGSPVCCLPRKMVEMAPVQPLFPLNNIGVLSGVCSTQQVQLIVIFSINANTLRYFMLNLLWYSCLEYHNDMSCLNRPSYAQRRNTKRFRVINLTDAAVGC